MTRFAMTAFVITLIPVLALTQDVQPPESNDAPSSQEQIISELKKENAELRKELRELKKVVATQSELEKQVTGKSYRITIGKQQRVWTFAPNGVLISDGKPTKTRWSAFGGEGVVCAGFDNGNVDICHFSKDERFCEVIYVGDFRKSSTRHPGELVK